MFIGGLWRTILITGFCSLVLNVRAHSHTVFEVTYDQPVMLTAEGSIFPSEGIVVSTESEPGHPDLPWKTARFAMEGIDDQPVRIRIIEADTIRLTKPIPPAQPRVITSDTAHQPTWVPADPSVYNSDLWFPPQNIRIIDSGVLHSHGIATIEWCPFRYNPRLGRLIVIRRAEFYLEPPTRTFEAGPVETIRELRDLTDLTIAGSRQGGDRPNLTPGINGTPSWTWPADPPLGVEYVVVTSEAFSETMRPLVEWKARRGINAGLATIETILTLYPGIDGAESLRNYLKAAYASGLQWVVLAGDETVVPIRLAYAGYKQEIPAPHDLQICDLYFAELDGNWDADGDGIWGEYLGDEPELLSELHVGRLPFSEDDEARAIVEKIIAYEAGPANADYLTQVLDVCADQMRDWSDGLGQHELVANYTPAQWQHNDHAMVESPTGDSPTPVAPDGPSLPTLLSDGFGWVNYFAHGRADGIVVRAPGYEGAPKSYVWTFGDPSDGHGHLNDMTTSATPGIHVSIGCDHGGFDMDTPPFEPGFHESVAERLLFTPEGGAAAFIGQSRWGWVSTSYRLIQELYKRIDDNTLPNHIGLYHTLMKQSYPSYRDLIYGNNLYGDPEMPVWKDAPRELEVVAPEAFTSGMGEFTVNVSGVETAIPGLCVTLSVGDSVWILGPTGIDGMHSAEVDLPETAELVLTAYAPGYRTVVDTIPHSIVTDVGGDDPLPRTHTVELGNYPNPFNPSTVIQFELARSGAVELTVFDILGRPVARLIDGSLDEGLHQVLFGPSQAGAGSLPSGIYLARLRTDRSTVVHKMTLLR
ncbi:MAG: hypothetical protein Kow0074_19730 [Candidatus Zixiibacteriota bacterium]